MTKTDLPAGNGKLAATVTWSAPIWADAAQTRVNITLDHPIFGPIPFTLDPTDGGAQFDTAALFAVVTAAGGIAPYVAPA